MKNNSSNPKIPAVTANQMRQLDDLAVNKFSLEIIQMMENAGRGLAELARREFFSGDVRGKIILVLAGPGGNGGGGMVAARRLHNWGAHVYLDLIPPSEKLSDAAKHQLQGLQAAGIRINKGRQPWPKPLELIIDALFGYSLSGPPRPPYDQAIRDANGHGAPILALDLPSGLHPDSGKPLHPAIRASNTLTLALPKIGLLQPEAGEFTGDLWLADISLPRNLYQEIGIDVPTDLFAQSDLIPLR